MNQINVPGSKSVSNRAVILSAMTKGESVVENLLECEDVDFLKETCKNFGVQFLKAGKNTIKIISPEVLEGGNSENFIGNGGTPARLLGAMSTVVRGKFSLHGVDRMHSRPFKDLFDAVQKLGVRILFLGKENFLPAEFENNGNIKSEKIEISGATSSQFISGLLCAGTQIPGGLEVEVIDEIKSRPYVEMTLEMLKIWGVDVEVSDNFQNFKVPEKPLHSPEKFVVPSDCSSASYPIIFSLLQKVPLEISNFGKKTFQGDEEFLEVAKKFGAKIKRDGEKVIIYPPEKLRGLGKIDFSKMPDVSMSAMAAAAFAGGESIFTGLESLRVKECDRVAAMAEGLENLGADVLVLGNVVKIKGNPDFQKNALKIKMVRSFDDHRIAMIFGVLRKVLEQDFEIQNPNCVTKSWPNFWADCEAFCK